MLLATNPSEMTPAHPQILKLLISGKMYSQGFAYGQTEFTTFNPQTTGISAVDVMSYYYYLGFISTALKQYEKAIEAFRLALVQPTFIIHTCILHSYQKYLLVSMLAGKSAEIPKAAADITKSFVPNLAKEYKGLYEAMMTVLFP